MSQAVPKELKDQVAIILKEIDLGTLRADDVRVAAIRAALSGIKVPYMKGAKPPVQKQPQERSEIDSKPNPMWLVELRDIYVRFSTDWFNYYGHQWPALSDQLKQVHAMAKQSGLDLDKFSPETFSFSDINRVDDVLGATDDQLRQMRTRIRDSNEIGLRQIDGVKKKRWSRTISRVLQTRSLCRNPIPPMAKNQSRKAKEVWEYTHALRYMIWTMRSNTMSSKGTQEIVSIPPHLVKASMNIAIARKHAASHGIRGCLIRIPQGHGKSFLKVADRALQLNLKPSRAAFIVHHSSDIAKDRFDDVAAHFDDASPIGIRRKSLFPNIVRRKSRRENRMMLLNNGRPECLFVEGNYSPRGVHSSAQGISTNEIDFDDPSDEKEQQETGTRERTNMALSATWLARMRGSNTFFVYICTTWHEEDFSQILLDMGRTGKMKIVEYSQECGGPEDGFIPIWPEMGYNAEYLKSRYYALEAAAPGKYACIYQNNPRSAATRKLSKMHFYDYLLYLDPTKRDEKWERFFKTGMYYLSADPAGTANQYSNLAGCTYACLGDLRVQQENGSFFDEKRLVFLDYYSAPASQLDLSDWMAEFSKDHQVDRFIIESTSGFHATGEDLVKRNGIASEKVIGRPPGTGTKAARFMRVAVHVENGSTLFPGEWTNDEYGDQKLVVHKNWRVVQDQLLRAGTTKDSNLLDSVRQQLNEVSMDLLTDEAYEEEKKSHLTPEQRRRAKFLDKMVNKNQREKEPALPGAQMRQFINASAAGWMN